MSECPCVVNHNPVPRLTLAWQHGTEPVQLCPTTYCHASALLGDFQRLGHAPDGARLALYGPFVRKLVQHTWEVMHGDDRDRFPTAAD